MDQTARIQETFRGRFPGQLGIELLSASKDCVRAALQVHDALCTIPAILHGGAIMSLADTLGACLAVLNLPEGAGTTTLESKTNFFAPAPSGQRVTGECRALHLGRRTFVLQTRVEREDGRVVASVTQTQMVLERKLSPPEQLTALFAGRSPDEAQALLAELERAGAGLYRAWAEAEADPAAREALLEAGRREDANAGALDALLAKRRA